MNYIFYSRRYETDFEKYLQRRKDMSLPKVYNFSLISYQIHRRNFSTFSSKVEAYIQLTA